MALSPATEISRTPGDATGPSMLVVFSGKSLEGGDRVLIKGRSVFTAIVREQLGLDVVSAIGQADVGSLLQLLTGAQTQEG